MSQKSSAVELLEKIRKDRIKRLSEKNNISNNVQNSFPGESSSSNPVMSNMKGKSNPTRRSIQSPSNKSVSFDPNVTKFSEKGSKKQELEVVFEICNSSALIRSALSAQCSDDHKLPVSNKEYLGTHAYKFLNGSIGSNFDTDRIVSVSPSKNEKSASFTDTETDISSAENSLLANYNKQDFQSSSRPPPLRRANSGYSYGSNYRLLQALNMDDEGYVEPPPPFEHETLVSGADTCACESEITITTSSDVSQHAIMRLQNANSVGSNDVNRQKNKIVNPDFSRDSTNCGKGRSVQKPRPAFYVSKRIETKTVRTNITPNSVRKRELACTSGKKTTAKLRTENLGTECTGDGAKNYSKALENNRYTQEKSYQFSVETSDSMELEKIPTPPSTFPPGFLRITQYRELPPPPPSTPPPTSRFSVKTSTPPKVEDRNRKWVLPLKSKSSPSIKHRIVPNRGYVRDREFGVANCVENNEVNIEQSHLSPGGVGSLSESTVHIPEMDNISDMSSGTTTSDSNADDHTSHAEVLNLAKSETTRMNRKVVDEAQHQSPISRIAFSKLNTVDISIEDTHNQTACVSMVKSTHALVLNENPVIESNSKSTELSVCNDDNRYANSAAARTPSKPKRRPPKPPTVNI